MAEFTEQWLSSTLKWRVEKFMSTIWRPRLRQIRRERARMSTEEQARLRSLGIEMHFDDQDSLSDDRGDDERSVEDEELEDDGVDEELEDDGVDEEIAEEEIADEQIADEEIKGAGADEEVEAERAHKETKAERQLREIRAFFTDVEVAEILKESARVNGLEDDDNAWFKIIRAIDSRQHRELAGEQ
ncbi:hypothetical protein AYL99_01130 [Fonsecaea erecta]|uniref:Uncharacterized protein n=1 Tax=Fonsecaea erecta TaxID=1367422 RepID=A0A178ZZA0_9EURO|nr:hypothetical protein AYL99_01130 [Fonsecaea erecta]OAP65158.1 hypothetical protein AYL99_01130 [Fonsecaea erecta]